MTKLPSRLHVGSLLAAGAALLVALGPTALVPRGGYWIAGLVITSFSLASLAHYRAHRMLISQIGEQRRLAEGTIDLHLATVEALALAIAAREEAGDIRLRRMQVYSAGVARALGMSEQEVEGVKAAALLHDIGKLAVPEDLLWKPGALARSELQKIRTHPQAGADLIGGVPFPYPVAAVILSHHERWDGGGYPKSLAGDEIPLGARILSAAEYFETLRSEPSTTAEATLERLQHQRGQALDPTVVDAFVRMYPALAAEADAIGQQPMHPRLPLLDQARRMPAELQSRSSALHDISLAHREVHALHDMAQAMSRGFGVSDTMELLANKLSALVPLSSCALFVPGNQDGTLVCRFATGVDDDSIRRLTMRDGRWSAQLASGIGLPPGDPHTEAEPDAAGTSAARTVLATALLHPLIFNERFVGMLAVYHTDPAVYTDEHARLLGRMCEHAAASIHHSIVLEQTQEDSLRDPLTGLPNARYLFIHLARELARAERLRSTVSLLVLDLDGFKDINDTFGHHVGDSALRTVAAALQSVIRPYDVCIRHAGDEFIVVLPACGRMEAERKRLEFQKAIDDATFEVGPGQRLRLAISVGLAVFPHDGVSRDELLAAADKLMYRDKTSRKRHGAVSQ